MAKPGGAQSNMPPPQPETKSQRAPDMTDFGDIPANAHTKCGTLDVGSLASRLHLGKAPPPPARMEFAQPHDRWGSRSSISGICMANG